MAKSKKAVEPSMHRLLARDVIANGLSRADDHRLVVAGGFKDQINVLDVRTGAKRATFGAAGSVCWYAEASCDGAVAAGFGDLKVRIWEAGPKSRASSDLSVASSRRSRGPPMASSSSPAIAVTTRYDSGT